MLRARARVCVCVRTCVRVNYKRPNGWTVHDQIWHAYVDRSGNGSFHKSCESFEITGPMGTKFGTRMQIHLEMDISYTNLSPSKTRVHWGGGGG